MKNRNRIFEAQIDEPEGFRMNPELKRSIERGDTPYSDSPFFPKKKEGERQTFEEKAATKRFADVIQKLQRYVGERVPTNLGGLQMLLMSVFRDVKSFEEAVVKMKLTKEYADNIREMDYGAGQLNSRAIVKWAFENKIGTVSEPFDLKDQYVVGLS